MKNLCRLFLFFSLTTEKGLERAEPKIWQKLKEALDMLEINPVPKEHYDLTKISSSESNYRIRIGRHRILYTVKWGEKEVRVFDIDKRKDRTYK